ncbi:MAG: hypothetical protein FJ387_22045 [Verrucomicrobia bacterium]|nr:hypothetical protein [Verrucomicrobiota bacterium]
MKQRHAHQLISWSFVFAALTFGEPTAGAATFFTDASIAAGDSSYDGQAIVVDGCTLTVQGAHTFQSLVVRNNGVVTHPAWTAAGLDRLELTVSQDARVEAGSRIDVSGRGYSGTNNQGNGPGGGTGTRTDTNGGGGGGAHGGHGGRPQSTFSGGLAYGSVAQPSEFGSAGGAGYAGVGGAGGGALRLIVGGTFEVSGWVAANGAHGASHAYGASGGGAGGSLWITAGALAGNGQITAHGGDGLVVSDEDSGGGSGGRIALQYGSSTYTGTVSARGGAGYERGGAGTIFTQVTGEPLGSLQVDNEDGAGALTPVSMADAYVAVTVARRARVQVDGRNSRFAARLTALERGRVEVLGGAVLGMDELVVGAESALVCMATNRTGQVEGAWAGAGVALRAGAATVAAGGTITADGQGYVGTNDRGNGPGGGMGTRSDTNGGGGGAGHGGVGGVPQSSHMGGPGYGSAREPLELGSAGGAGYAGVGGAGGGAIRLVVTNTLTIEGTISANGGDGATHSYGASGGGSGGSLWISAGLLAGAGEVTANGGNGPVVSEEDGGGGGGGRVAVYAGTDQFTGRVTVFGGLGYRAGGAGTVLRWTDGLVVGSLTLDNGGRAGGYSRFDVADSYDHVTIVSNAVFELEGTAQWVVRGTLRVATNGTVLCMSVDAAAQVADQWVGRAGSLHASDIQVDEGGRISAAGLGYTGTDARGNGPGGGTGTRSDASGGGGGGGHGGRGGAPQSPFAGGDSYGAMTQPRSLGSAGGAGYAGRGGAGGGAIHLEATRSLVVNGLVTADGAGGPTHAYGAGGGGAGGSIWITTGRLAGAGSITARGGLGPVVSEEDGGGGGGGRMAIYYETNEFAGALSVAGGTGYVAGGAGSLFTKLPSQSYGALLVDNGGNGGSVTPWDPALAFDQVVVTRQGRLELAGPYQWRAGQVEVQEGALVQLAERAVLAADRLGLAAQAILLCRGASTGGLVEGRWAGAGVSLLLGDAQVASGASITADHQGYLGTNTQGLGPGGGTGTRADSAGGGGGGGHGGDGGKPQSVHLGGGAHGDALRPLSLGSAGGAGYAGSGGAGGGAIRLVVTNTLELEGTISAQGQKGKTHGYGASGGGAGGSLWLTVGTLQGAGRLAADGGEGPVVLEEDGGGGAGGRIAVYVAQNQFTGQITAYGGAGFVRGGAGTVYLSASDAGPGTLRVDNGGQVGARTPFLEPGQLPALAVANAGWVALGAQGSWRAGPVQVGAGGSMHLGGGATLYADALTIATNAIVVGLSHGHTGQANDQWAGRGITIVADTVTVEEGGRLSADGVGYAGTANQGNGPGGGTGSRADTAGGGGGGHGGPGGAPQSSFSGGTTYGDPEQPLDLGSAGGAGYAGVGGAGGGAIRLLVSGQLTLDGVLSANGANGAVHGYGASGGGAGGSLWITAARLAGVGQISAAGGVGPVVNEQDGGGGGGGRIALNVEASTFTGAVTVEGGSGFGAGGVGTVHSGQRVPCVVSPATPVAETRPLTFHVAFARAVTGLTLDEIEVRGGTKVALTGSGANYELTVAPLTGAPVVCWVPVNAAQDAGGLLSEQSNSASAVFEPKTPVILVPPQGRSVPVGEEVMLSVWAAGTPPLVYAWFKQGQPLGETNATLVITNAAPADSGSYTVVVTNDHGEATSEPAVVTVGQPGAPAQLAIGTDASGRAVVTVRGTPGSTYAILGSEALANPTAWTERTRLTLAGDEQSWTDADSAGAPARFYRAVLVPY